MIGQKKVGLHTFGVMNTSTNFQDPNDEQKISNELEQIAQRQQTRTLRLRDFVLYICERSELLIWVAPRFWQHEMFGYGFGYYHISCDYMRACPRTTFDVNFEFFNHFTAITPRWGRPNLHRSFRRAKASSVHTWFKESNNSSPCANY